MSHPNIALLKRAFQWCLLVLVALGIGRYIYRHQQDFKVIGNLDISILALIGLVQLAVFLIMSYRYLIIMKRLGFRIAMGDWLRVFTISRFINTFIPHMGNVYRGVALKMDHGFSLVSYLASLLVFSYLDRLLLFALTFTCMALAKPSQQLAGVHVTTLFGALMAAGLAGYPLCLFGGRLLALPFLAKRIKHLDTVIARIVQCLRDPVLVAKVLASGVVSFGCSLLATWLAFYALGIRLTLSQGVLFNSLSMIMKFLPLTPGNVGTAEVTYAWLSQELNLEVAPAIIAAAALNVVSYVVFFSAGMLAGGGQFMGRAGLERLKRADSVPPVAQSLGESP